MQMRQATEISPLVRKRVYERDSFDGAPCCIRCGRPYPHVHHYIERSRGGLGIEENLVCLCAGCHEELHVYNYKEMSEFVRDYLKNRYGDSIEIYPVEDYYVEVLS